MLNDLEASLLRNLENRRQRTLDAQSALVAKLGAAVEHLEQCATRAGSGALSRDVLTQTVLQWYQLLVVLSERAAHECAEFTRLAADMDSEEMEEHEPGGYISQRLGLLNAAQVLTARSVVLGDAVGEVFAGWLQVAGTGIDVSARGA